MPLFSDAERVIVGTEYKQVGKRQAIELGLKIVGPKLAGFAAIASKYATDNHIRVHCWRGGMRSSSMAWLLNTVGMTAITLKGGYKSFRTHVLISLQEKRNIQLLGGLTGSGKTSFLHSLRQQGQQVLDLEALASHRGSCYGQIGMQQQPTNEQFENEISFVLNRLDPSLSVWIEDENRVIGKCCIPNGLYEQMQTAPMIIIERSLEERLDILHREYGNLDKQQLIEATQKLNKRLGGQRTKEAVQLISDGLLKDAMALVLQYYDQAYQHHLTTFKKQIHRASVEGLNNEKIAALINLN